MRDDEAQIRDLERIAHAVGSRAAEESEPPRLARAAGVRNEVDPQITVDAGPPFSRLSGRDAIIATIARWHGSMRDVAVEFEDVKVSMSADGVTARAHLTAAARYQDRAGSRGLEGRELAVSFRKRDAIGSSPLSTSFPTLEP